MQSVNKYAELLRFAEILATASAGEILPLFRRPLAVDNKVKTGFDPVTEADRAAERVIRKLIEENYPDHGIIGEEYGEKPSKSGYNWILDPIDGTRAFVVGLPTWATLIALYHEGKPIIGAMHQPFVGELYLGSPEGAWIKRNGQTDKLAVRTGVTLPLAHFGTTSPHLYADAGVTGFDTLRQRARLTRYGCDAYSFAMVAAGHLDLAADPGLQIYDIAALIPIITGAGGYVTEWSGGDPNRGGNIVAAGNRDLLDEAAELLRGR
jgi:myo-inositol-1(or 4)-monophosphatase